MYHKESNKDSCIKNYAVSNKIIKGKVFKNKKNQKIYTALNISENTTNYKEQGRFVCYQDNLGNTYIRELQEFFIKFEEVFSNE